MAKKGMGVLLALALAASLAACGGERPGRLSDEERIPPLDMDNKPTSLVLPAASSAPASEEEDKAPPRPETVAYEIQPIEEGMVLEANGRSITFENAVNAEAAKVLCNAWMSEVSGEFWRWEVLCQAPMLRQADTVGLPYLDALAQGYNKNQGYKTITVQSAVQVSNERLYTTNNAAGNAQLLLPYYQQVGSTDTYEDFVDWFIGQGNRVVYFQAEYEYMPAHESKTGTFYLYYIVAPDANGRLVVKNSTQLTGGAFQV